MALLLRPELKLSRAEAGLLLALVALSGWYALSILWSPDTSASVNEVERTLVYLMGALAFVAIAARGRLRELIGGALGGIAVISTYSLATRLFPERLGNFDPFSQYRLATPLGYWNALGAFAAIGALLAVGFALRGRTRSARCAAAALLPILVSTQYFTFSRGAWIALGCGLAAAIAIDTRRLQLVSGLLVLALPTVLAGWLAASSAALVHQFTRLSDATRDGHRLALAIVLLAIVSAAIAFGLSHAETRLRVGERARRAYASALLVALAAGVVAVFAVFGPPPTLAQKAWDSFKAPPVNVTSLNQRLLSLSGSGRVDAWRVALHDFAEHPLIGSGAGTYAAYWDLHRPSTSDLRDAHSLYLETMAELGIVGFVLLVAALAVPLVVAFRVRRHPLLPAALGAFVAYLVDAGVDWDWEMPALTLAGLFCGLSILVLARGGRPLRLRSLRARSLAVAALLIPTAVSLVGLVGHEAATASARAASHGRWQEAERQARKAMTWEPWSPEPWRLLAEAKYGEADLAAAARYYRTAIEKDPRSWRLWFDLGFSLDGKAADAAFSQARRLDPRNPEIPAA
jgi:O-antigen ligase